MPTDEKRIQQQYYAETAHQYDDLHLDLNDAHHDALGLLTGILPALGIKSILDVGSGTGRSVKYFIEQRPELLVRGIEPVAELRQQATIRNGIPPDVIIEGSGESLPFPSESFDAVCEFGMLHHVRRPDAVVSEMMRVAKRAVIISDSNRFGQGSTPARLFKLLTHTLGLWPVVDLVKTRGRGYSWSPGDGVYYSYSVYDSLPLLENWTDKINVLAVGPNCRAGKLGPLLGAPQVLLIATKDGQGA